MLPLQYVVWVPVLTVLPSSELGRKQLDPPGLDLLHLAPGGHRDIGLQHPLESVDELPVLALAAVMGHLTELQADDALHQDTAALVMQAVGVVTRVKQELDPVQGTEGG